jgi:hydrogenase large subunit
MRCEVNIDSSNIIRNAVSTGTMWRGLEVILKGRDPRDAWAFVQRICGVCTGTHALTSVRAVENALKIDIPENANSIRNIMQLSLQVHDHLVHFYHLHALDWVNPVNALKADPKATSVLQQSVSPSHPNSSPGYFRDVQTRLRKFVESGQLGPFKNGYWTNPAYKLPPKPTSWPSRTILKRSISRRKSCACARSSAARTSTPTGWWAGFPAPSTSMATWPRARRSTWRASTT